MHHLIAVTLLWAFSFSLIGEYLSGRVDDDFAVLTRVVLAGLVFVPLVRWRAIPAALPVGLMAVGALQFGLTYLCFYRSFAYLTVPEVLLFTVTTPIYVALIDDASASCCSRRPTLPSLPARWVINISSAPTRLRHHRIACSAISSSGAPSSRGRVS